MAEVPNNKILEKYRELLTARTHDVIVMQLAIEMLETNVANLVNEKGALQRENQRLQHLVEEGPPDNVIQGEVVDTEPRQAQVLDQTV